METENIIKKLEIIERKLERLYQFWKPIDEYESQKPLTEKEADEARTIINQFKCRSCNKDLIRIRGIGLRCRDCNKEDFNKVI